MAKTDQLRFAQGDRYKAIQDALDLVKKNNKSAKLIICRDVPGEHTGGEDCFCKPDVLGIYPEDL